MHPDWLSHRQNSSPQALVEAHPDIDVELVEVTTTGDRDKTSPVATLTEIGAFVKSVQYAVLDGDADVAVHSGKDLPVEGPEGLVAVHPAREAPWDVLCGSSLDDLAFGARVGTGSPRRSAQLRALRPDVEIAEIRGNVETRLRKLDDGEFNAIVLAEAGLARLGLSDRIDHRFSLEEMIPAAAQGALTVETTDGSDIADLLDAIDDPHAHQSVAAERAVLAISRAGCRSALGVHATLGSSEVRLDGFTSDTLGPRTASATAATGDQAAHRLCDILEIAP